MSAHIDPAAIQEATDLLVEEWHRGPDYLDQWAERTVRALVERRDLLVRLLGIPRPGPCGDSPELLRIPGGGPFEVPTCSLDAGHTGGHKDERIDSTWWTS